MRRLTLMLALGVLFAAPSSALAVTVTQTAQLGQIGASFRFTVVTPKHSIPMYSAETLTITRPGSSYSFLINDPLCGTGCQPGAIEPHQSSVRIVDIAHTGEPQVILDLYSGGAHCCSIAHVFNYSPATGSYTDVRRDFGDPGYSLVQLSPGGPFRFVTADDNFAYAFTSFAQSGLPLQILGFSDGKFVDVTRSYPARIKKDAAGWWGIFRQHLTSGTGVLAAWAADEELLHHDKLVQRTLKAQLKAGHLVGGDVNGRRYITALNKLLHKLGYR